MFFWFLFNDNILLYDWISVIWCMFDKMFWWFDLFFFILILNIFLLFKRRILEFCNGIMFLMGYERNFNNFLKFEKFLVMLINCLNELNK